MRAVRELYETSFNISDEFLETAMNEYQYYSERVGETLFREHPCNGRATTSILVHMSEIIRTKLTELEDKSKKRTGVPLSRITGNSFQRKREFMKVYTKIR